MFPQMDVGLEPGAWVPYTHASKAVGKLSKDGATYLTYRSRGPHFVRKYQGYGVQRALLKHLIASGVTHINLVEHTSNQAPPRLFKVEAEWWWRVGTHDVLRAQDGAQVFVSVRQLEKHLR